MKQNGLNIKTEKAKIFLNQPNFEKLCLKVLRFSNFPNTFARTVDYYRTLQNCRIFDKWRTLGNHRIPVALLISFHFLQSIGRSSQKLCVTYRLYPSPSISSHLPNVFDKQRSHISLGRPIPTVRRACCVSIALSALMTAVGKLLFSIEDAWIHRDTH